MNIKFTDKQEQVGFFKNNCNCLIITIINDIQFIEKTYKFNKD